MNTKLDTAIKLYEKGKLSSGQAAEMAGLSRKEFILSLDNFGVSPFQYSLEDLIKEINYGPCRRSGNGCT